MDSLKTQFHLNGNKDFLFLFKLYLATIGVAFFRCVASVTHFLFVHITAAKREGGIAMKKLIVGVLAVCVVFTMCSCSGLKDKEALQEEQSSEITNNLSEKQKSVDTESSAIVEFCKMASGIWVNTTSCETLDYGDVTFSFCRFSDEGLSFGDYPGEYGRVGKITAVAESAEGQYSITLFYPAEEYMGDVYEKSYEDYKLCFDDDSFYFAENSDVIYTYMGVDIDSAIQSVTEYLSNSQ